MAPPADEPGHYAPGPGILSIWRSFEISRDLMFRFSCIIFPTSPSINYVTTRCQACQRVESASSLSLRPCLFRPSPANNALALVFHSVSSPHARTDSAWTPTKLFRARTPSLLHSSTQIERQFNPPDLEQKQSSRLQRLELLLLPQSPNTS